MEQGQQQNARAAIVTGQDQGNPGSALSSAQAALPNGARAPGAKRRVGARNEVTPRVGSRAQTRISCARPVAKTASAESACRVHHGIDFLKLSIWLDRVGDRFTEFLDHLKELKRGIQETEDVESIPIGFDLHDAKFNLCRTGTRFFPYRLVAGDVVLLFGDRRGDSNMPTARLEIGSITSQTRLAEAVEDVHQLFASLYTIILKENIAEIHMAADFIGVDLQSLDVENMGKWITKGIHFGIFHEHRTLTGVTLGKGDLMLRIYDKTRELRQASHKQGVFAKLWGVQNYDDQPVTRVEYQLRRPVLKSFFERETGRNEDFPLFDMTNFQFLFKALRSLWAYCTEDWSRFCETIVDRKNKHQSRAILSAFWQQVKGVVWEGFLSLKRDKVQEHKDLVRLQRQATGILMTIASFFLPKLGDVTDVIDIAKDIVEKDIFDLFEKDRIEFMTRMERKRNAVVVSLGEDGCVQEYERMLHLRESRSMLLQRYLDGKETYYDMRIR